VSTLTQGSAISQTHRRMPVKQYSQHLNNTPHTIIGSVTFCRIQFHGITK